MKQGKITAFRIGCLLISAVALIYLEGKLKIVILLASVISALFFGRLWCGYICPLGFYQELLSMLRKKLHIPTFNYRTSFYMHLISQYIFKINKGQP